MLPLLLHLRMHDEERVVREVNGDLALGICILLRFLSLFFGRITVILWNNATNPKLSSYSERNGSNDCMGSQIGELVTMISDALGTTIVAVHERCIWLPLAGRLVLEFLAIWILGFDTGRDFQIDHCLDFG
jgi:hypothetical protein